MLITQLLGKDDGAMGFWPHPINGRTLVNMGRALMNSRWSQYRSLWTTFVPEQVYQAQACAHRLLSLSLALPPGFMHCVFGHKLPCRAVKGILKVLCATSQVTSEHSGQ